MRRVVTAIVAAMTLTIGAATPVSGQELGVLEIDPEEGSPGDLVQTQLPVEVIAEHCVPDAEALSAPIAEQVFDATSPLSVALETFLADSGLDINDPDVVATNPEAWALTAFAIAVLGVAGFDPDAPQAAWEASFVLSFASLPEQEMVGEMSNFDPATGEGDIVVPDVAPGLWAIAAVCLGFNENTTTQGTIAPLVAAGSAWTAENLEVPYPQANLTDPVFLDAVGEVAPIMFGIDPLGEGFLIVQGGPWAALFCVDCDPLPSQELLDLFCLVLPEIEAIPAEIEAIFAGVDIDDPDTYPSVETLQAFVERVSALLDDGDTSVPADALDAWTTATAELRELVLGLTAVGFDFATLVALSPEDAERLVEVGSGDAPPDPEFDAAVAALTEFFLDNCLVAPDDPEDRFEDLVPAAPIGVTPRFTG